jgi:hypothetical protein
MVVGSGRGNWSGTGAADAFVDAYRRGGEIEKGLKAIDLLWGELWMMCVVRRVTMVKSCFCVVPVVRCAGRVSGVS